MNLKHYSNLNNESGTTLIELLAAITILSIIVISFLGVFIQSARTNTRASDLDEMTFIAQGQMEEIVNYSQTLTIDKLVTEENFEGDTESMTRSFNEAGFSGAVNISRFEESETLYSVIVTMLIDDEQEPILENRLSFRVRESE